MLSQERRKTVASNVECGRKTWPVDPTFTRSTRRSTLDLALKRALDILGSLGLLIVMSPALLFIAFLVKREDGGPVFFRQERHGLNGAMFNILKFRTMGVAASAGGFVQCQPGDARVTRIGRHLRRTSLDELPQLINVLMGDMSLVGPRPHAVEHDFEACQDVENYWDRYSVLPGMTGLAQIRGHRGTTAELMQMKARVQADLEYVANGSFWLDLRILLSTTSLVISAKNAH